MKRRSLYKLATGAVVLCAMALFTLPLYAQENGAISVKVLNVEGTYENEACFGEAVGYSSTLHLVLKLIPDPPYFQIVHGNQIHAEAWGEDTGTRFVFGGSPSNLVPAGDGYYLYHLTFVGPGPDAPKFSITAKGNVGEEPIEVIQSQCVNPAVP